MHRKSYKHGQVVFREGDSSREVYFIIRGDFAVSAYVSVKADDE
jgi:CRP-like cAMP-binding protein